MEESIGSLMGIVEDRLGPDRLPIYAPDGPTAVTSGAMAFGQWYRDIPGVNQSFLLPIPLTETSPGTFTFDDSDFFPLDGMGWPGEELEGHNFHFTTEIHTSFTYRGGERFTFRGDDDVWIFVNERLALDLGGVHGAEMGTIDFDAQAADLGITPGNTYRFEAFHAERHTSESNFRIETSIDCFGPI
jgi:fibro-slime domain-containing protein